MVGPEGSGFKLALNALNLSRAFVATLAVGIMQRALDEAVKYAKERKQFGEPLIKFQMVQQMLADMAIKTEASRVLVNNTMRLMDNGSLVRKEGSITKAFVSDCAQEVTSNAVQIDHEGSGIGLYLVKSLVEIQGGTISVESKFGHGTKFTLKLPVKVLEKDDSEEYTKLVDNMQDNYVERIKVEFSDIYR